MKYRKTHLLALLILPWLTIPFLGRNAFKKYAPAALFMCAFTKAINIYGERKKWWRFYKGIFPFSSVDFLNLGPYFVTSLWVLKKTYGRFRLFLITNTILQFSLTYLGGLAFLDNYRIASLKKLSKFRYLAIDTLRTLLLYGFQYIKDQRYKNSLS